MQAHVFANQVTDRVLGLLAMVGIVMTGQPGRGFFEPLLQVLAELVVEDRFVQIAPLVSQMRYPRQVVDACAFPFELVVGDARFVCHVVTGTLHGVAETYDLHLGHCASRRQAEDAHRVRVVEYLGVWAQLVDIAQDVEEDRSCTQRLEEPARADGVTDALVDPVLAGDIVVTRNALDP